MYPETSTVIAPLRHAQNAVPVSTLALNNLLDLAGIIRRIYAAVSTVDEEKRPLHLRFE